MTQGKRQRRFQRYSPCGERYSTLWLSDIAPYGAAIYFASQNVNEAFCGAKSINKSGRNASFFRFFP
jgi:hypothetical protein